MLSWIHYCLAKHIKIYRKYLFFAIWQKKGGKIKVAKLDQKPENKRFYAK